METPFPIQVRTLSGLEHCLAEELKGLGALDVTPKSRVVLCRGDKALLYRANFCCRYAIRVLLPVHTFPAPNEKAFYDGMRSVDWARWVKAEGTLAIDANLRSSFTTHSLFLAQLAKDAVVDQFRDALGRRPSVDLKDPDLRITVSLYQNTAQISVDASGASLHKRGYRQQSGDAPLNETLAAGILKLSGWSGVGPLCDPMCGSGTFLIEAALLQGNIAPGLVRKSFGFQKWPDYDSSLFREIANTARRAVKPATEIEIRGRDIDPKMLDIARENARCAGVAERILFEQRDLLTDGMAGGQPGTLVLNPPYDERLSVDDVVRFYGQIGESLKRSYPGWTAYLLTGNPDAAAAIGLNYSESTVLYNGPIECRLFRYELTEAGQKRRDRSRTPLPEPKGENPEWLARAEAFANRLKKNARHLSKWAKREGINAYRIYHWDIPELPFFVDRFNDNIRFAEVPRNYDHSQEAHERYLRLMVKATAETLGLPIEKVSLRQREERPAEPMEVSEAGLRLQVDPRLYLDERELRALVREMARKQDVLNLYSEGGALTLFAAAGGARSTTSVDNRKEDLLLTERSLRLNEIHEGEHNFVLSEVGAFLADSRSQFDLILLNMPRRTVHRTFSAAPSDKQRLLELTLKRLRSGGTLLIRDDSEPTVSEEYRITEITAQITPPDFERKPTFRCWSIQRP